MSAHTRRGFFGRVAALVLGAAVEASTQWLPTTPRLSGLADLCLADVLLRHGLPEIHFRRFNDGVSDTDPNPCAHLQIIMSEKQARVLFGDGDYQ